MSTAQSRAVPVAVPEATSIARIYPSTDLADAYAIALPDAASDDPEVLARFVFTQRVGWVDALMWVRDALVAGFGLKTATSLGCADAGVPRVGIFRIYDRSAREIVLGEDDRHLDFRLSVLCEGRTESCDGRRLVASTVVHCHNLLGRIYIRVVAPFHRIIMKHALRRAALAGWPRRKGDGGN